MRKISCLLVVALGVLLTSSALAFDLGGYVGPVDFKFTGYSESGDTTYDPGDTYGLDETYLIPNGGGLYPETWAIVKLSSIEIPGGGGQLWSTLSSGEDIYGMVYGLYDWDVSPGGTFGVIISQRGGFFDLYLDTDANDSDEWLTGLGPSGRTGSSAFTSVTNTPGSSLFLSGLFNPGVQLVEPDTPPFAPYTTMRQDVTGNTSPVTGQGSAYADLTGGNYMAMFDTDGMVDGWGQNHDLRLLFDIEDPVDNGSTVPDESQLWSQSINDPMRGNVKSEVPEPASMLLLGIGMLGFAAARRKKAA